MTFSENENNFLVPVVFLVFMRLNVIHQNFQFANDVQ